MQLSADDIFFKGYFPLLIGNVLAIIAGLVLPRGKGIRTPCLGFQLATAGYLLVTASLFPGCGMAGPVIFGGFVTVGLEFVILLCIYRMRLCPPPPGHPKHD